MWVVFERKVWSKCGNGEGGWEDMYYKYVRFVCMKIMFTRFVFFLDREVKTIVL